MTQETEGERSLDGRDEGNTIKNQKAEFSLLRIREEGWLGGSAGKSVCYVSLMT